MANATRAIVFVNLLLLALNFWLDWKRSLAPATVSEQHQDVGANRLKQAENLFVQLNARCNDHQRSFEGQQRVLAQLEKALQTKPAAVADTAPPPAEAHQPAPARELLQTSLEEIEQKWQTYHPAKTWEGMYAVNLISADQWPPM